MTTMRRIYLPLTAAELESLRTARELAGETLPGFAVTAATTAAQPGVDDDELHEFVVGQEAARAALAADGCVVAAADVAGSEVAEDPDASSVRVSGPLPLKRFASFHLIDREAADADPEADVELSWFDATELDLLLDVVRNS